MSVKMTGSEWKAFVNSSDPIFWPHEAYMDEYGLIVNGVGIDGSEVDDTTLGDGDQIVLDGGTWYASGNDREGKSLESVFKAWRKAQTTEFLLVEVPKESTEWLLARLDEFRLGGIKLKARRT